jgi:predicted double-glycine peptidase
MLAFVLIYWGAAARAEQGEGAIVEINIGPPGMTILDTHKVKSLNDLRHDHVQLQERDFSCGAASMTSIFNYYLESQVSEVDVIKDLLAIAKAKGTLEKVIERRGFTLLDLKHYAESKGFKTSAFKLDFKDLVALGEPALVPIIPNGYKHFVVFRGADAQFVYLADPSFGNLVQTIDDFKHDWYGFTNVALVVHRKTPPEKGHMPPLMVSKNEQFNPKPDLDSWLSRNPPSGPLVPTEFKTSTR